MTHPDPTKRQGDTPTVYDAEEAARRLKCKVSWLKKKASQRAIPVRIIGGAYRWTPADLEQILAQMLRPAATDRVGVAQRRGVAATTTTASALRPLRPRRRRE